ncbi:AI-2E family transporter [Bradyrhizobium japonicum]|uniref:AI-2E family transporter n=1 Tax=Bradyrhizobium japonicum TaxID=375 RepID=UPI0005808FBD|nr:AI-2E family transporter [Bradyrhizobium japonicum]MCD9111566.1 AI-2E family transporter [Bradyrhizobium japonicum]MCD9257603.1 AI-2E family transporter [Bradyrhizobium japonicum SEMIA 5079]MCD9817989.1 AI-2E family transporter [Bradyrhizobium japonicum]MCD9890284.1 AI-2E family transporter [Bradyrhizobium japonicum]MCD9905518.1 AI-2E family transporter [Bradyrhizobium japonicum]
MEEKSPQIRLAQPRGTVLTNMAVAALTIAALYFGREIFVPFALAVLLSFVLAPFVMRLRSWRIPRTISVLVVVFIGFSIIFSLGGLMVSQATRLAAKLPGYQQTLSDKIESLRGLMGDGSGTLEQASTVLKELKTELQNRDGAGRPAGGELTKQPSDKPIPIPVEVRQPDPGALSTFGAIIQPLISPLTTTGIVVIFVVFVLLQREDLRNRLVRLAGSADIQRTTAALDDAGKRLSKLFLTQIAFNGVFGLAIGIGLEFIGVPSAPLWGLVAMIMRFVPYIGALISSVFPLILAAAVGPGWQMLILTAALFVVLELLAGQVLEPLIFGHSSGLSPIAIILSASFWTWLWGPVGLVLATPLTICLVVLGRHVDRLKFLDVMLGDRPPLTPPQLAYQRMLAGDPIEAVEQAHEYLNDSSLENYYDDILLKGLRLAEADRQLGHLDQDRLNRVVSTVEELVAELGARHDVEATGPSSPDLSSSPGAAITFERAGSEHALIPEPPTSSISVICIPGAGRLDEATALVLAQLLRYRGIQAIAEKADASSMSKLLSLELANTALVCVCYLSQPSTAKIQHVVRGLSKRIGATRILFALLGTGAAETVGNASNALVASGSFGATLEAVVHVTSAQPDASDQAKTAAPA